jgi:hypothetical protein
MMAPLATLQSLESKALYHLQNVDFETPLHQLDQVFEALMHVPTRERRSDTAFALRAKIALDMLIHKTDKLAAYVHSLNEHVGA